MSDAVLPEAVAVLGGSFDPVHEGHLHLADTVRRVFAFPRVLLMPCAVSPHKTRRQPSPAEDRLEMLRLAVAGAEGIEISMLEIDRGGVSYTIDTLRALRDGAPPVRPVFVLGMDSLIELPMWREAEALVHEFDLVALDRPGGLLTDVKASLDQEIAARIVEIPCREGGAASIGITSAGRGGRIFHVAIPPVPVSSSLVRSLAAAGAPLDDLVPPPVARYIQSRGLYRQEETS